MGFARTWIALFVGLLVGVPLSGQEQGPEVPGSLNLFFDCQGSGCWDLDFFRREIPFVNWVRDREDSDVHVLVTSQSTGGGGRQYRLRYLGRGDFQGREQELVVNTSGDATDDEVRTALAARLRLGLGPYLAGTPLADQVEVTVPNGGAGSGGDTSESASAENDPWNFWVFTVRGNAFLDGESSYTSSNLNTSLSANRTTDAWKVNLSGRFSRYHQSFEVDDTSTVESTRKDWRASGLLVGSVTDRVSLGVRLGAGRSTYYNEDFRWNVAPGVELNLFPYTESSRRSLTLQALVDVRHWDYAEETIFNKMAETRPAGMLVSELELVQPWGRTRLSLSHSRYFHDAGKWQATLGGFVEVRVFKGFSVNMRGNYGWIRDQLYITLEDATEEEILLRQQALATDFSYYTSFGISYRFGSIFNNVVNPRFGDGGF